MTATVPEYGFTSEAPAHTAAYLRDAVMALLPPLPPGARILDIGCGNGFWAGQFLAKGFTVVGIDPSEKGITIARRSYPKARFEQTIASSDLLQRLGEPPFDVIVSTEVVEHLYSPRDWASAAFNALKPGGRLICSTPYHGYIKNLALAVFNKWDWHVKPLWDGGHIKFWSRATLTELLLEPGFVNIQFRGAGRAPYLWMSMVMSADRPAAR